MAEHMPIALMIIGILLLVSVILICFFQYPSDPTSVSELYSPKKGNLKNYTDDELYVFMQNNNNIDCRVLAAFCSEILRRQLEKERMDKNVD